MRKFITGTGNKRILHGIPLYIRDVISIIGALYLIFAVLLYPQPILHRSIAFGFFFSIIFLGYTTPGIRDKGKVPFYDWALATLCIGVSLYIGLNIERISSRLVFVDTVTLFDILFGIITLLLLIEGGRRILGPWLPGIGVVALAYIIFGHYIPGKFGHLKYSVEYIIDGLFLTDYGVWGRTMGVATGKIMVFMMFATLLQTTKASDFLFAFVSKIAGRYKGGIGKVAVVASALFGMISGGGPTNATTTGSMTIPIMKKSGFSSEYAACVESAASVGGVFMPPIMGSMAFIMSDIVGIPYADVIRRAALPALIYFAALFMSIDFKARKSKIDGSIKPPADSIFKLIIKGYNFFIPLAYLITRLMMGRPAAKAGLETLGLMIVIGVLNRKKPLTIGILIDTLKKAVGRGTMIVATMATCGILIGVIDVTGVASKLSAYLSSTADVSALLTILMVMLLTLFLGLAMNGSSTYLIAAVLGAPVLIGLGYEPLSVHMFIIFYAAMATVTPPVALTSYVAATIAGADPTKVGWMTMKVGLIGYILPFAFIFNPAILQIGSFLEVLYAFGTIFIGTGILAMGLEGWLFNIRTGFFIRILLIASGIMVMIGHVATILIAAGILAAIMVYGTINMSYNKNKNKEIKDERN